MTAKRSGSGGGGRRRARGADAFLPLKASWLHILIAVAAGRQHGYAIRQEVEERTEGRVRLWPATLYGALAQLVASGLLEEVASGAAAAVDDDARRRYYGLTALGRRVLDAETRRLEELVRAARTSLVAQRPGGG